MCQVCTKPPDAVAVFCFLYFASYTHGACILTLQTDKTQAFQLSQGGNDVIGCRNDTAVHHAKWSPVAPMKTERGSLAAVTVGDYIYAIGGGKPNMQYDTVER